MSENVLFLWDNAADRGTVSASSETATMPASNLQDPQRSNVWRSSGASPQNIDITLAADEPAPIAAVAIVDHNLTPAGTIRLRGWADGLGVGTAEVDEEIEPWAAMYGYGVGGYGLGGYGGAPSADTRTLVRPVVFVPLSDYSTLRYWRLTLTDDSLAYVQAGRVYVGTAWQPETNMSWGLQRGREELTQFRRARGGQRYGNPRAGAAWFEFELDWLTPAERDALWMQYAAVETHTPFIFCARPVGGADQMLTAIYGRFERPIEPADTHVRNTRTTVRIVEDL